MTLKGFKEYLERKIRFFDKEMENLESQDNFDFDAWKKLLASRTTTIVILQTYLKEVLEIEEKDA